MGRSLSNRTHSGRRITLGYFCACVDSARRSMHADNCVYSTLTCFYMVRDLPRPWSKWSKLPTSILHSVWPWASSGPYVVSLWTSKMVVHIFFICPNRSVWDDRRAAFQLLQCGAEIWYAVPWSIQQRCWWVQVYGHKSDDVEERREPNLVQPCPWDSWDLSLMLSVFHVAAWGCRLREC